MIIIHRVPLKEKKKALKSVQNNGVKKKILITLELLLFLSIIINDLLIYTFGLSDFIIGTKFSSSAFSQFWFLKGESHKRKLYTSAA